LIPARVKTRMVSGTGTMMDKAPARLAMNIPKYPYCQKR